MNRTIVNPWTWQDPYGFVQANAISGFNRLLVCAGQAASAADGSTLHVGNMRAQITAAMDNLETVLRQAGFQWSDVVRLCYYTTDVDRFVQEHDVVMERMQREGCRPASTLLGVARLASPEMLIEIEATAAA